MILIIVYFGKWPSWFHLFLQSCKNNPDVNFLIFTDCEIPTSTIANIVYVPFSLTMFNALASHKLTIDVSVDFPYKLCDYRPAYGVIFENYIKNFSFWGYCDIDLIFGKITNFIRPDILSKYDIISARKEYLTGHFTLYRNVKKINLLYKKSSDYKKVFLSKEYLGFDECSMLWWPLLQGWDISKLKSPVFSISHVAFQQSRKKSISFLNELLVEEQDKLNSGGYLEEWKSVLFCKENKLYRESDQKEVMYFHFHFMKKNPKFHIPDWENLPSEFVITKEGFFEKQSLYRPRL